jgi:hypothetical protein
MRLFGLLMATDSLRLLQRWCSDVVSARARCSSQPLRKMGDIGHGGVRLESCGGRGQSGFIRIASLAGYVLDERLERGASVNIARVWREAIGCVVWRVSSE